MSLIKWKKDEMLPTFHSLWDDYFNKDFFDRGLELGTTVPAVNISETDERYHLEVAVPGYQKEDFDIDVHDNVLVVSSEKKEEKEEMEGKRVSKREFSYSSFRRTFQLPSNVAINDIAASYTDGILKIDLPKLAPTMVEDKRKIEIN